MLSQAKALAWMKRHNQTEIHTHTVNVTESEKKTQDSGDSMWVGGLENPVAGWADLGAGGRGAGLALWEPQKHYGQ